MDERDDETTGQPASVDVPEAAGASAVHPEVPVPEIRATEIPATEVVPVVGPALSAPEDPAPTEVVPVVGPALSAPEDPLAPPSWVPLMPLSMPPFDPSPPADVLDDRVAGDPVADDEWAPSDGAPPPPPWFGAGPVAYGPVPPPPEPPRSNHRTLAAAAVAALLAGGLGAGLGAAFGSSSPSPSSATSAPTTVPIIPTPGRSTQASSGPSESVAAIAKAALPAIVDIDGDVASETSTGQEEDAGTGMIITSSGEVLTNNHVVEDATKITVSVQGHSGTYAADVIGVDPTKDVALLQIEGFSGPLPTIRLGNSSTVAVGSSVVAMGNAQGLGGQPTTVTGIVSALGRTITASDESEIPASETLHGLIETDAPIQPGDSGGPLLNSKGEVIGMDTAASSSSDSGATLGFAIPIDNARAIVQAMEKGETTGGITLGESPFLGIFEEPDSSSGLGGGFGGFGGGSGTTVTGVAVSDVAIGSPAEAAGIVGGDTITKVDSTPTPTITALQKVIGAQKPGSQVTVTYVDTSGETQTATVTLEGIPK
jgi:S1-C subfamily serine protease